MGRRVPLSSADEEGYGEAGRLDASVLIDFAGT
jgi:hypothetical protein